MKPCLAVILFCGLCLAQAPAPTAFKKSISTIQRGQTFAPMTGNERVSFLTHRLLLSPGAPAPAVFMGAFDQMANDPEAWGQGWDAYGRRVASRWARTSIRNGIESGSAAALGFDQRYIQCNCDGGLRRAGHALAMNFVTYNRRGHWVPNAPRIGSTIAAEFIGRTWLPPETRTAGRNLEGLGLQLLTGSLANVWREFSPPLVRRLKSKLPGH